MESRQQSSNRPRFTLSANSNNTFPTWNNFSFGLEISRHHFFFAQRSQSDSMSNSDRYCRNSFEFGLKSGIVLTEVNEEKSRQWFRCIFDFHEALINRGSLRKWTKRAHKFGLFLLASTCSLHILCFHAAKENICT
jgi:hypothetical protein